MNASGNIKLPPLRMESPTQLDGYMVVARNLLQGVEALSSIEKIHPRSCALLAAHALECVLKAFLWHMGKTEEIRKPKIQHNLKALWDMSYNEKILNIPKTPPDWVKTLNEGHGPNFYFRYQEGKNHTVVHGGQYPAIIPMVTALRELFSEIESTLKNVKQVVKPDTPSVNILNSAEKEAIGLCISLEAIDSIANHILLELRDVSGYPGEAEVLLEPYTQQELFMIRLLDFVKESGDSRLTGVSGSCLKVLQSACDTRSFNHDNSIDSLKDAVDKLDSWLNHTTPIKLWLPTLGIEAEIEVSRLDIIAISGNQFKHNLSRLTGVSKRVHTILKDSGYTVPLEHIPLALEDFREHLQENYFAYYGTWIAELLNDIRWGIQAYLLPSFTTCYVKDSDLKYHYEYPKKIVNEVARSWFWRLMNNIRRKPYLKKFTGAHYLKEQSSLERREQVGNQSTGNSGCCVLLFGLGTSVNVVWWCLNNYL